MTVRTILLPLLLLGACATGPDRATVLNSLVGQPETEAVRVLGVPSRSYDTAGHRFLAFTEQRSQVIDGGGPFLVGGGGFYGGGFGVGPGFGPGFGFASFPTEIVPRICETTLDVSGGRVQSWALRGNACG